MSDESPIPPSPLARRALQQAAQRYQEQQNEILQMDAEAQITDGDHVELRAKREIYRNGELQEIQLEVQYGTKDGDGNFVPRPMTSSTEVPIRDTIQQFKDEDFSGNAPGKRKDPVAQGREAAIGHADKHGLWPTE